MLPTEYEGDVLSGGGDPPFLYWIHQDHLTAFFNLNQLEAFSQTKLTQFYLLYRRQHLSCSLSFDHFNLKRQYSHGRTIDLQRIGTKK